MLDVKLSTKQLIYTPVSVKKNIKYHVETLTLMDFIVSESPSGCWNVHTLKCFVLGAVTESSEWESH